jgi:hypothetical protein
LNGLFSKDIIELIIIVLGAGIPVSLYVARLHWKINRLERDFNNNPLLVLSKTWEENQGGTESNPTQLKLTVSDHGEPVIEKMFTPVTQID